MRVLRRGTVRWPLLVVFALVAACITNFAGMSAAQAATFTCCSPQTYVVPAGVTLVSVTAQGGSGEDPQDSTVGAAGLGALVTVSFSVTPGESLSIVSDWGGSGPGSAGDGGNGIALKRGSTFLVVAGGGGGGGGGGLTWGGVPCACNEGGAGGNAGSAPATGSSGFAGLALGGGGATVSTVGAGGIGPANGSAGGSFTAGGNGGNSANAGGGGGGGYKGGGGGAGAGFAGGGAGGGAGASYIDASGVGGSISTAGATGAASISINPVDLGDNFQQGNNVPSINVVPATDSSVTPALNGSDTQQITVDATDIDGGSTIATVKVCVAFTGTSDCTSPNTANSIELTWSAGSNSVSIAPAYNNSGASSTWRHASVLPVGANDANHSSSDVTGTTASIYFRFKFSEVARAGTWSVVSAEAIDTSAATATDTTLTGAGLRSFSVPHFSAVTVSRVAIDFGTLEVGEKSTAGGALDHSAGTVVANSLTDVTYILDANFQDATHTYVLGNAYETSSDPTVAPGALEVAYACIDGATFPADGIGASRIPTTGPLANPSHVSNDKLATGTTEAGYTGINGSCQIWFGSGNAPHDTEYQSTVVTGTTAG